MQNKIKGDNGERIAAGFLKAKGYDILCTNFRSRNAEIDIIAEKAGVIVFAEVKLRSGMAFGYPREAVNHAKQSRIKQAAEQYIYTKVTKDREFRFDVVEILSFGAECKIEHVENAFY